MKQCLIVDNSDVVRKVAARILESLRFQCAEAAGGPEALERCRTHMPDMILLDWLPADMTGLDFIASLRQQPGGARPIVIYCTSENDPADIGRALGAGADEFLLKPFDRVTLTEKLSEVGIAS